MASFEKGHPGTVPGSAGGIYGRGKTTTGISAWLKRILAEYDAGGEHTNYEAVSRKVVGLLTGVKIANRDFITLLTYVTDRIEGKPVNVDLLGNLVTDNPLLTVDTGILMARLQRIRDIQEKTASGMMQEDGKDTDGSA